MAGKGLLSTMANTLESSKVKPIELLTISDAAKVLGLTRQALFYRMEKNIDNILVSIFSDERTLNSGRKVKRYFLKKDYVMEEAKKSAPPSKEFRAELINLYWEIYKHIEDCLASATDTSSDENLYYYVSTVDRMIYNYIISHNHAQEDEEDFDKNMKSRIRNMIKQQYYPNMVISNYVYSLLQSLCEELKNKKIEPCIE